MSNPSTLTLLSKTVAYKDQGGPSNQPLQKHFDWTRSMVLQVEAPKANAETIPSGGAYTFFSGTVGTSIDGTTGLSVTRSPLDPTRFRFTWSGGTAPVFRSTVGLTLSTRQVTVAVQSDATVTMTLDAGTWGSLAEGNEVFIPGTTTGDSVGPFSALNEGWWTVLAVLSPTAIQVARRTGAVFSGTSETVTVASDSQVLGLLTNGVAEGDGVDISAGFSASTRRTFVVEAVTNSWFEVVSTVALPLETGKTPGATGMVFFTAAKRFLGVETDQEVSLRINGMTTDHLRIGPLDPADTESPGEARLTGPVWSLTVVNRSAQAANVTIFTAE